MTEHGQSRHPLYVLWHAVKQRCEDTRHPMFSYYGGRGIGICREWQDWRNFIADMEPTYRRGLTLDRIDNSAGYSKSNCRWVSRKTQAQNRRSSYQLATPWGSMCAAELAERCGVNRKIIYRRLAAGKSVPSIIEELCK